MKPEYAKGVDEFLDYAFTKVEKSGTIRCPCVECNLGTFYDRKTVRHHLMYYGILTDYVRWTLHGEDEIDGSGEERSGDEKSGKEVEVEELDETDLMVHELEEFVTSRPKDVDGLNENDHVAKDPTYHCSFSRIIHDSKKELFPGCCSFTRLEFMIHLLHIKTSSGWSEKSFGMLLQLLKKPFDLGDEFPKNCYEAKKYTKDLGLGYENIDTCRNYLDYFASPITILYRTSLLLT